MNENLGRLWAEWEVATANLKWGVQRAFHDVFTAVRDNDTTLIYGSDYMSGFPCLVNSVGQMLQVGGGNGVPSANFGQVVGLFDQINRELYKEKVNTEYGHVSPLAAEFFIHNFAPLKEIPVGLASFEDAGVKPGDPYVEVTDDAVEEALRAMFLSPAPVEIERIIAPVLEPKSD